MNLSKTFIDRPIATALFMAAIFLLGALGFTQLPVAFVPKIDFPTISVGAGLPGASPETMATSVAAPLERQFGQIPGLTQMTSRSVLGRTSINLQFELTKDLDEAVQEVQAALTNAQSRLPRNMPSPPTWRKTNPAEARALILIGAISDTMPLEAVNDFVDTRLAQKLSQIQGVGSVGIFGERKPAVRVQVNPTEVANRGMSIEDIRDAIAQTSVNQPKGNFNGPYESSSIDANDQIRTADDYRDIVVAYKNGAPVKLSDVADVFDSVENARTAAWAFDRQAVVLSILRQPGANMIDTANRVVEEFPKLIAGAPESIRIELLQDRTELIRAAVADVEFTLMISVALVIMVIFMFLRKIWSTVIPAIAIPLSLTGTFGVLYALGYSIDNISMMALTIAVGFVVDDAIVMIENIVRHMEHGETPYEASIKGSGQIGPTIVSITFSLIAVFIPLFLMGGIIGRMFQEFAATVAIAVLISALVSLTLTPTMCARFLTARDADEGGHVFKWVSVRYGRLLRIALNHRRIMLATFFAMIGISVALFLTIPKGFFPQQDTGFVNISMQGAQNISFDEMVRKSEEALAIVSKDPAVDKVEGSAGGGPGSDSANTGTLWAFLKPFGQRDSAEAVMNRLRPQFAKITGLKVFMTLPQDITVGNRSARTQYQYTLQSQEMDELSQWATVMYEKLQTIKEIQDISTDQENSLPTTMVTIDRATASRLGVSPQRIDDTLYSAFGQRQVSTIFTQLNQYHVILEVQPQFQASPTALDQIYVKSASGKQVPLSAVAKFEKVIASQSISHQDQFPAITLSFNLSPGVALGDAVEIIKKAEAEVRLPATVTASFQGTAQAFQDSLSTMPFLILAAIVSVYIVLGILYESFIHPLTILSTLPSAGVGALMTLWAFHYPLDLIALIGVILLIGIVKKNAIMMVDFALEAERRQKMPPQEAIYQAAVLRFRPIMMTTMCALFGALPLMLGTGAGSELRQPLGYAIVGGLIFSQMLTLFTTPVVYLYLGRFGEWIRGARAKGKTVEPEDEKIRLTAG